MLVIFQNECGADETFTSLHEIKKVNVHAITSVSTSSDNLSQFDTACKGRGGQKI